MLIKIMFFMLFSGLSGYISYIALYLERIQLTGSQIGVLLAIQPLMQAIATPFVGMLADAKGWHKRILIYCSLAVAIITPFYILNRSYIVFIFLQIILFATYTSISPILDKIVLNMQSNSKIDYGEARVFGSIGFAFTIILIGILTKPFDLYIVFIFMSVAFLILAIAGLFLEEGKCEADSEFKKDIIRIFTNKKLMYFFLAAFFMRIGVFSSSTYFGIYMDRIGGGDGIVGYSWGLAALIEIPVFLYSTKLLKKYGIKNVLLLSFIVTYLQITCYNFAVVPLTAFIVHMLKGVVFAIYYIGGINYIQKLVPEGVQTTGQTLFVVTSFGISGLFGNFIGGLIYQNYLISYVYIFSSVMALTGLILLVFLVYNKKEEEAAVYRRKL